MRITKNQVRERIAAIAKLTGLPLVYHGGNGKHQVNIVAGKGEAHVSGVFTGTEIMAYLDGFEGLEKARNIHERF